TADPDALRELLPVFLAYLLSFVYLGIYWNNHHHLLQLARLVSGGVLWADLHLLVWLSLVPVVTGWIGGNRGARCRAARSGQVAGIAYMIVQRSIIAAEGENSKVAVALGRDVKGKLSAVMYAASIPLSYMHVVIADAIYVIVAVMWLVPDSRLARRMQQEGT